MRRLLQPLPFMFGVAAAVYACSSSNTHSGFAPDASTDSPSGSSSGGLVGDGGSGPRCAGLQCAAKVCDAGTETTLTGTVYDPAGNLPLYNVYVYIPNSAPAPIQPGSPTCTACQAPASGTPVIGASTDATGRFTLTKGSSDFGVPTGDNGGMGFTLVLQVGKWRKQIHLPSIAACATTNLDATLNAGMGTARQLRLPAKSSEGDMPLIAFTSGCDPAECFLRNIGIDDSEFVPPGSAPPPYPQTMAGAGHVHFYTSNNYGAQTMTSVPASSVTGGNTPTDTYNWWNDASKVAAYDIVFNACECSPFDRGPTAYAAIDAYLQGGGRLFATHYFGNWFIPQTGTADLQSVASWASTQLPGNQPQVEWNAANLTFPENDAIDQTFPKGQAYATWLQTVGATTTLGSIGLTDTRDDVVAPAPAGCASNQSCLSTQWIYNPGDNHPRYLSLNAPVGQPSAQQCGRAMFSDVHLSGQSNNATFPAECSNPNIDLPAGHAVNEQALEFLFFDLASCVQNDNLPPPPPPPTQ
jgi:hypothetical protein